MKKVANDLSNGTDCPLILINIANLADPSTQKQLQSVLFEDMVAMERAHYNNLKQIYDHGEFDSHFASVVTGNDSIHSLCRGIIASEDQYLRDQISTNTSTLAHLMVYMSKLSRGICIDQNSDATQMNQTLEKIKLPRNKQPFDGKVHFAFHQREFKIDMDNIDSDAIIKLDTIKLARMAFQSQSLKVLPVLHVSFKLCPTSFEEMNKMAHPDYQQYKQRVIKDLQKKAKKILSELVFELQNLEVILENVIISTNFAETLYLACELKDVNILEKEAQDDLTAKVAAIAFHTSRLYYATLPPAIPAIYNSISFCGKRSRVSYIILNQIESHMKSLSCWASGILIEAPFFEDSAKAYSIIRRLQPASITLTQQFEKLTLVWSGQYNEDNQ